MIFFTFSEARLMARLATYATGSPTSISIRRTGEKDVFLVINKTLAMYQSINHSSEYKVFGNYFDFPEEAAFWLFDKKKIYEEDEEYEEYEKEKLEWWGESDLITIESLRPNILGVLRRKYANIKDPFDIQEIDINRQIQEDDWETQALEKLEAEKKEKAEAAAFERKLVKWNADTDKEEDD